MNRCCSNPHTSETSVVEEPALKSPISDAETSRIRIEQMDCPTEEKLIRGRLGSMPDVSGLEFNLLQRTLTVNHAQGALPELLAAIRELGMTAQVYDTKRPAALVQESVPQKMSGALVLAGVAAVCGEHDSVPSSKLCDLGEGVSDPSRQAGRNELRSIAPEANRGVRDLADRSRHAEPVTG